MAADDVGVERDQFVCADHLRARLLEPRVRVFTRRQQAGLDVVATLRDHLLMKHRPQLVLRTPRPDLGFHRRHGPLGRPYRLDLTRDLVGGLDRPGSLDGLLRVDEVEAEVCERDRGPRIDPLDADRCLETDRLRNEVANLAGPAPLHIGDRLTGCDEGCRGGVADLGDGLQPVGEMQRAGELVEHDRAVEGDEEVPRRIPGGEDLHIAGTAGVADVDRVGQQDGCDVARCHLRSKSGEPAGAQRDLVDRRVEHRENLALGRPKSPERLSVDDERGIRVRRDRQPIHRDAAGQAVDEVHPEALTLKIEAGEEVAVGRPDRPEAVLA